ncbi:MAG: NAD/NADP octopine/nopaline dehydrogenase family protein [Paludibacteraceae bacterium]|nr:NAD/NADP octopine/nopaline dehydrogenase family protein [Paludibacteraceae bacterium]
MREDKLHICICGGGGLGHTTAGVFSSQEGVDVSLLTSRPDSWSNTFCVNDPIGKVFHGRISHASCLASEVIPTADLVLLCLPAFLVEQTLRDIAPNLRPDTQVGAVVGNTGFFIYAHEILPAETPLFAFQRAPYISRVVEYGKEANLLGYKDELLVATENIANVSAFCERLSALLLTPVRALNSFYEVTLSNSNPILHTGRLYTMWKDWDGTPYAENPLFYYGWTDEASKVEIQMDQELFVLLKHLNIGTQSIKPLLEHYDSADAAALTRKLRSIPSYAGIYSPMKQIDAGWVPDFTSRYFTEDFPYGLKIIHDLAHKNELPCPMIDKVYEWGCKMIER